MPELEHNTPTKQEKAAVHTAENQQHATGPTQQTSSTKSANPGGTHPTTASPTAPFRQTLLAVLLFFVLTPATLVVNHFLGGSYYLPSMLIVLYAMLPFFVSFEARRPKAREIVLVAVICALAATARIAFYWLPGFKPMAAVIAIAGIALGAHSGFLVGSVSMLASNMFFTQGSWTPWQMLAYGLIGFVAGLLADRGVLPRESLQRLQLIFLAAGAFVFMVVVVGPILDTSTLFFMISRITPEAAAAIYLASVPVNVSQGIATVLTLLLVGNPLLGMIARVKRKYGM